MDAKTGPQYFESGVRDAYVPGGAGGVTRFKGILVTAIPDDFASQLIVEVGNEAGENGGTATLRLMDSGGNSVRLRRSIYRGAEIEFAGIVREYTSKPYNLVFEVHLGPDTKNVNLLVWGAPPAFDRVP